MLELKAEEFKRMWREYERKLTMMAESTIERILEDYPKARFAWNYIKNNEYIRGLWEMADYIVVSKMKYNAHGDTHAKVVAANALKILNILLMKGYKPDIVKDGIGDTDDTFLVVLLSALLHDIGNGVERKRHNHHSVILAEPILMELLSQIYSDKFKLAMIKGAILHAIYTHMEDERSYTMEASIVKVADGTDMTKGRSRIPYDLGNVNIHTVSAMSVDEVEIVEGAEKPVEIRVYMTNSAGVFQVEEILHKKLMSGCISHLVDIVAKTIPEKVDTDERIVRKLVTEDGRFVHIREY